MAFQGTAANELRKNIGKFDPGEFRSALAEAKDELKQMAAKEKFENLNGMFKYLKKAKAYAAELKKGLDDKYGALKRIDGKIAQFKAKPDKKIQTEIKNILLSLASNSIRKIVNEQERVIKEFKELSSKMDSFTKSIPEGSYKLKMLESIQIQSNNLGVLEKEIADWRRIINDINLKGKLTDNTAYKPLMEKAQKEIGAFKGILKIITLEETIWKGIAAQYAAGIAIAA